MKKISGYLIIDLILTSLLAAVIFVGEAGQTAFWKCIVAGQGTVIVTVGLIVLLFKAFDLIEDR